MKFFLFWRVVGTAVGLTYAVFAFDQALDDNRFRVLIYTSISAIYLFGAAKSHSHLRRRVSAPDR